MQKERPRSEVLSPRLNAQGLLRMFWVVVVKLLWGPTAGAIVLVICLEER